MDKKKIIIITVMVCLGLAIYDSKANNCYMLKSFAQLYDSSNRFFFKSDIPSQRTMIFNPDAE